MRKLKTRLTQICSLIKFVLVYIPALVCKIFVRNSWLICDTKFDARDNGYWLYKCIREKHPNRIVHFAISKKSSDYQKLKKLGNVINYDSFAHWFWYIICRCNISSQASGKPETAIAKLLERIGLIKNKFCFLQHGVTINDAKWLYAHRNHIDWFLTAAKPEHEFIVNNFGYDTSQIKLLGFSRFDNLHSNFIDTREILLMPTWRAWINLRTPITSLNLMNL